MSRPLPDRAMPALGEMLGAFGVASPVAAIQAAAVQVTAALPAQALGGLNDGQYAALISRMNALGPAGFSATRLARLIAGGNHTLVVDELLAAGDRGKAELAIWLAGNPY